MNSKIISALTFFALLIILPAITLFRPKKEFSDEENRYLAKLPKFSASSYANKDFMNGFDAYFSDHFISRTRFKRLSTDIELMIGKTQINGVYILPNRLIAKVDEAENTSVNKSINAINTFSSKHPDLNMSIMLVPTAQDIYAASLPHNSPHFDEKKFISIVHGGLHSRVNTIDAHTPLQSTRNEYIYYRYDHHWTTLGAYYGYTTAAKKLGFTPTPLNNFDIEYAADDFYGTLYSKTLYDKIEPDRIELYHLNKGVKITKVEIDTGEVIEERDSIYFREFLDKKDKYSVFLGQNQPIVNVHTDNDNNERLLIFKDSYAHSMVPFLMQHYSEITLIDLRYINVPVDELIDIEKYTQAIVIYNTSNFLSDDNIIKLGF
ncbi:MAG: hypothetical protein GX967_01960 [Clostridiales bacterium]|nr:hypothetical protein [Clostridiales bacterium]